MPCPEQYKNLGLASFGEQKYVTADMLRQFCMNDAYLKAQVDDLKYLSPPAVRKRFTPVCETRSCASLISGLSEFECSAVNMGYLVFKSMSDFKAGFPFSADKSFILFFYILQR